MKALLKEMDDPQEGSAYIHVAGTNGKGSVSLIIANILNKAGYKVGRYTSPHLTSYCERFTVNNEPITPEELKSYLDFIDINIQAMLQKGMPHPTEFEVLTAAAFQFFSDRKVDIAVLEVGMGGIYDSTNVIIPLAAVITSISYDHTAFLGNTIEEIALNKAGIIKSGVPVIVGSMAEEALTVIKTQAEILKSPFVPSQTVKVEAAGNIGLKGQIIKFSGALTSPEAVYFSLAGKYQRDNLAVALTTLTCLTANGYQISDKAIREGLSSLVINGRMQVLHEKPLVIADAAHNQAGSQALAGSLAEMLPGRSKVAVIGIVDDKDARAMLMSLGANTKAVVIARPEGDRGKNWGRVALIWQELFPEIYVLAEEDIHRAMTKGLDLLNGDDYLLVTGSFYVLRKACQYHF
ncbi:MAG: bifunctional folylpolyglutamate synthase/dihydrofolate synthase [Syntrophomonadaceae bacterium]|nr:bifunctional folylpolyglutamate synthase/dihydrofolate synthase [Syntrophomonadaceae bacterium]